MATGKIGLKYVETPSGWRWRVRYKNGGKDERTFHKTKELAEAEIASVRDQIKSAGEMWVSLSAFERNQLMAVYREAREKGIDLRMVLHQANANPVKPSKLADVIEELKTSKQNNGASKKYVRNMGVVLSQFARGRESLAINLVTLEDVETFLDTKKLSYRQTLRGRLSTLFNFAVRRKYRLDNPCALLEPVKITKSPPAIFTTAQFRTAVEWLVANSENGLAWFALSTVCGLRPEEAEQTTADDVHFKEGFVKVEAQTTKVRQRRVVYPRAEAMAFLKWAVESGGSLPFCHQSRRQMISGYRKKHGGLRKALGFDAWPKDITRHTAASYWLAGGETAGIVSEMLGNSERILKRDYKALVTRAQAEEFWNAVKSSYERQRRV